MVMMQARIPNGAAPDSPDVTDTSPLIGAASILMPFAAAQSGAETKVST